MHSGRKCLAASAFGRVMTVGASVLGAQCFVSEAVAVCVVEWGRVYACFSSPL